MRLVLLVKLKSGLFSTGTEAGICLLDGASDPTDRCHLGTDAKIELESGAAYIFFPENI